ncbi:helix-turn-helix domain-containing protein [Streptomyces sp. NPDC051554]|uniref:helix-turn-helix domain-containing protein n=1 Tax=Streptomyces sp. NPDC051554 TaxID=3365656 RepID=UPI0037BCD1EB
MANRALELGPIGERVAAHVARVRTRKGWDQKQLSERLAAIGRPMSPSVISKIEQGDRRIDVDDLVALAVALQVYVGGLLLPLDDSPESIIDLAPGHSVPADVAWAWLRCERPLEFTEPRDFESELEAELFSLPPGRRGTWKAIRGRLAPESRDAPIVRELSQEDEGDG